MIRFVVDPRNGTWTIADYILAEIMIGPHFPLTVGFRQRTLNCSPRFEIMHGEG